MGGFKYALRTPMGGDAGTLELAVPDVRPGERLIAGDGRRLLVLEVVDLSDRDGACGRSSRSKS